MRLVTEKMGMAEGYFDTRDGAALASEESCLRIGSRAGTIAIHSRLWGLHE